MWMPKFIQRLALRNYAVANEWVIRLGQPIYPKYSVEFAVKKGYVQSGWVYRAIFLLQSAASQPPWAVYDSDGTIVNNHPLNDVLRKPHPFLSSKEVWKLVTAWMNLTGNAYFKKVKERNTTKEFWPISPDRIAPVPAKNLDEWLLGYTTNKTRTKSIDFEPEEIIHMKFIDPANPLIGIGPFEPALRSIGVDIAQQDWNVSAMKNRGVLEGILSFKEKFNDQDEADIVRERINQSMSGISNARKIGVVGGEATYSRTGANAVEMDYIESRRFNREETFIIFGVPPLYAGALERATLNNYQTSQLIFWFGTVIPFLLDMGDQMTFSLDDELAEGERILPDISNVPAVQTAIADRAKTAEIFHDMGVPMEQINSTFNLGFQEYDGWDESQPKNAPQETQGEGEERLYDTLKNLNITGLEIFDDKRVLTVKTDDVRKMDEAIEVPVTDLTTPKFRFVEYRSELGEEQAEKKESLLVRDLGPQYESFLREQGEKILKDVELSNGAETWIIINDMTPQLEEITRNAYIDYGVRFGVDIVYERQDLENQLNQQIRSQLIEEQTVLIEVSQINETTAKRVIEQINEGMEAGVDITTIQQAIIDVGVFDEARALRIGRTVMGSAGSIGQFTSAKIAGAQYKIWQSARANTRQEHLKRDGEKQKIDELFTPAFGMRYGPRYPLDPKLVAADRINCRCSMSFA